MAHGHPDYGVAAPSEITFSLQDLAELAARLKSIDTFDRRGRLVWLDDFEDGLVKWNTATQGTGAAVAATQDTARNGGYSCKLTTGNLTGDYAEIGTYLYLPRIYTVSGLELHFATDDSLWKLEVSLNIFDGDTVYWSGWRYYDDANQLDVRVGAIYQTIDTNQRIYIDKHCFIPAKVVTDLNAMRYKRLLFNNTVYAISGILLTGASSTAAPHLAIVVRFTTREDVSKAMYIDDVIVTQDEP